MTRIEEFLTALLNGNTENITPQSRVEQYLLNCVKGCGCDGLPMPKSRLDALLYALADKVGGASDLIVFSINENTYIARSGMTWEVWTRTAFNTIDWYYCDSYGQVVDGYGNSILNVSSTDTIVAGTDYVCY